MEISQLSNSATSQEDGVSHTPTVLIIDDDEFVRESLEFALQYMGYQTYSAINGSVGIEFYKNSWESVDLVLLDFYMPGMNGEQTFHELIQLNPDIRCIFSSGLKMDMDHHLLSEYSNHIGFLYKPYDLKLLKEKITELMVQS